MKAVFSTMIIFALVMFLSSMAFAQELYDLNYKYEKNKTYLYRTTSTGENIQNENGQNISIKVESKTINKIKMTNVTTETFEFILSPDSSFTKRIYQNGDEKIDKGENLVGKRLQVCYGKYGTKIKRIEIDPIQGQSNVNIRKVIDNIFQLPDRPVQAGDTWKSSICDTNKTLGSGNTIINYETEYKLEGKIKIFTADCLKISFQGSIKYEGISYQGENTITSEGKGETKGYFYFNHIKGLISASEINTFTSGSATISGQNIVIPMTMQSKVSTTLLNE